MHTQGNARRADDSLAGLRMAAAIAVVAKPEVVEVSPAGCGVCEPDANETVVYFDLGLAILPQVVISMIRSFHIDGVSRVAHRFRNSPRSPQAQWHAREAFCAARAGAATE
jgi:hypothetical protein